MTSARNSSPHLGSPRKIAFAGSGTFGPARNSAHCRVTGRHGCCWPDAPLARPAPGRKGVREMARRHPEARIALIASSLGEARRVTVEGESVLLAIARPEQRPLYESSLRKLTWPNGAQAQKKFSSTRRSSESMRCCMPGSKASPARHQRRQSMGMAGSLGQIRRTNGRGKPPTSLAVRRATGCS